MCQIGDRLILSQRHALSLGLDLSTDDIDLRVVRPVGREGVVYSSLVSGDSRVVDILDRRSHA
jgi:hypothetical protein